MRLASAPLLFSIPMLVVGGFGCSAQPVTRSQIVHRFIDEDPKEIYDPLALVQQSKRFEWSLDDPEEWARWVPRRPIGDQRSQDAFDNPSWVRLERLGTETISAFELVVSKPPANVRFALSWAAEGQHFSRDNTLWGRLISSGRRARSRIRFDLRDHPGWQGEINRLRLRIRSPREHVRPERLLRTFSGLRLTPPTPEERTAALGRFWKIDLDGDVRNAMLTPSGTARTFEIEVPASSRLRFAIGTRTPLEHPVTVRVEAFADDRATTLYSGQLVAGNQGWKPALVDLAPLAGRRARLRFRVLESPEPTPSKDRPVVAWAHPEVLRSYPIEKADSAPPHVVLVSIDTLRADHLSLYGYALPTSPHLDTWAAHHASVFLNAVAQAPWTLPSHASMLSGLNAHRHGVNHIEPIPESVELLAERLRRAGYTTIAVTGGVFLHPRYGFAHGFDRYVYWNQWQNLERRHDELAEGLAKALAAVDQNRDEPLFLFFHTYEPHTPYLPREPFFTALGGKPEAPALRLAHDEPAAENGFQSRRALSAIEGEDGEDHGVDPTPDDPPTHLHRLYDSGVAYTDAMLHRLLERIEGLALRQPTMVVITSDHGEALGDDGRLGHGHLHDDTLLVPLVIRTPTGLGAGRRITQQVRSIDIVPTILELAGLPAATDIDGRSLVDFLRDPSAPPPPAFKNAWSYATNSNRGLALRRGNRLKYILNTTAWAPVSHQERIYDLRRDPRERKDLAGDLDTSALRDAAIETLAIAPGLRLRISRPATSSTTTPLSGELRGQAIHPLRLEQVGAPCQCIEWLSEQRARFTVAPGQQLDLLIEEAVGPELTLSIFSRRGRTFETTLALDELDTRRILSRQSNQEWTWSEEAEGDRVGLISVWWQGPSTRRTPGSGADKDDLEASLRALGYL